MTVGADGRVQGDPGNGTPTAIGTLVDTIHYGMSEKYTLALGGGGPAGRSKPGDYLYYNGDARRTAQGAWGIVRVLPSFSPDLLALPDNAAPGGLWNRPGGGNPPAVQTPSNPCPTGAPVHAFDVSAIDLNSGNRALFVATNQAAAVKAGTGKPEPLVLHVAAGECVKVHLTNTRSTAESFAVGKLDRNADSSGVDVGYSPENNTAPGATRDYWYYADSDRLGSATISDFAGDNSHDSQKLGLYGAVVVAQAGAKFSSDIGARVDVHIPATATTPRRDYRDFSVILADNDPQMSQDFMPYPTNALLGATNINYAVAPPGDSTSTYGTANTDPATPTLWSYAGDTVVVHEIGPGESYDAWIAGGAGGYDQLTGDYWYGDLRRPFTQVGAWGLQRVLPIPTSCAAVPVGNPTCLVPDTIVTTTPTTSATPTPTPTATATPTPSTSPTATPSPTRSRKRGR